MGLKCGIVGLPNVGKSTLFNALTKAGIAASNYPFCTIEPNVGVVNVPDKRLRQLADIVDPQRILPTTVEFVDIAGLVKGAAQGEGLGNQFLANIRETDAIIHIVRCFEDPDITHVHGNLNPLDDIEVIETELALADLATVEKALVKCQKLAKAGDKAKLAEKTLLEKLQQQLNQGLSVRSLPLTAEERAQVKTWCLLTDKPVLYVANVAELADTVHVTALENFAAQENSPVVALCARIEAELAELDEADKLEFLQELGLAEPGLERVIHAAYDLLGLQTFFTAGKKEVRAWTVRKGALAPQAAGVIHTDFERGFIRAEVIAFADYIACQGEQGAKSAGKLRLEGKDYIIQDGDVILFRFNV